MCVGWGGVGGGGGGWCVCVCGGGGGGEERIGGTGAVKCLMMDDGARCCRVYPRSLPITSTSSTGWLL